MTRYRRFAIPLFWAAILVSFTVALLPQPPQIPGQPNDKVQHILAFLLLSALAVLAYPKAPLVRIFVLLSVFGALIEVFQGIPALHRDASWRDWVADTAAAAVALGAVGWLRARSAASRAPEKPAS